MDLSTSEQITWCPGCGNHSILAAIKQAIFASAIPIENIVIVYGIGCHGHMVNYLKTYGFEGLHGRPIPVAEGIKLANPKLTVLVVAGDGDTFGEGLSHFIHACRRNINLNLLIHDNRVYGLTTGQTSPTSAKGFISKSTPAGTVESPISGLSLALSANATFVAQELAIDIPNLRQTINQAIKHQGLSYVNILQQCPTFNKINSVSWLRENTARENSVPIFSDRGEALKVMISPEKLTCGVIYQEDSSSYEQAEKLIKTHEFDQLRDYFN